MAGCNKGAGAASTESTDFHSTSIRVCVWDEHWSDQHAVTVGNFVDSWGVAVWRKEDECCQREAGGLLVPRADVTCALAPHTIPYPLGRHGIELARIALRPALMAAQCACPPEWEGREGIVFRCRWRSACWVVRGEGRPKGPVPVI